MKKLQVRLRDNSYDILISQKEKDFIAALKKFKTVKSLFIVTDSVIAKLHLKKFVDLLTKAGFKVKFTIISAGETSKSIKSLALLYDKALKEGLDRKACVIAFGGGVVGDLAGFFASTYMRGIKLVQVPTTLLSMSDSSVGGKTAVNVSGGKNIAGTFYQPSLVWINSHFLLTLPMRQIKNGLAEITKYSFTFDNKFYDFLLGLFERGSIKEQDFEYMIYKSCSFKASVVEKDEKETKGIRDILNFGHTLAHAIETYTGYKKFLHGEAVAIGILFASKLSVSQKLCKELVYLKVKKLLEDADLIFKLKNLNAKKLVEFMKKDKKSIDGKIKFVLLKDIGKTAIGCFVSDKIVEKELREFLK